jgi:hypothetical protein
VNEKKYHGGYGTQQKNQQENPFNDIFFHLFYKLQGVQNAAKEKSVKTIIYYSEAVVKQYFNDNYNKKNGLLTYCAFFYILSFYFSAKGVIFGQP